MSDSAHVIPFVKHPSSQASDETRELLAAWTLLQPFQRASVVAFACQLAALTSQEPVHWPEERRAIPR